MTNNYYISTPIFYPNGAPHIGHAYNAIASDVIARFYRLSGKNVLFVSGTDEHGLKMQKTAEKQGISPQELADKNSAVFQHMLKKLNCSNDDFIRTSQTRHHEACAELWKKMQENGDIYLAKYSGWYSVTQEAYYDEAETYIDENNIRREKQLNSIVEWNEEESYFFRLSKYQEKLLQYYEQNPDFIMPISRRNEIYSFVKSGLRDISISRTSFDWGIKVPSDNKHIMYVWVDALTNYLTATGYPHQGPKNNFWPANLHMIGKDIIRFHAIYWPAFLLSAQLPLPKRIFAHGFLLNQGEKMSKSVGNVISPFDLTEEFGVDQLRYFLLREVPFGQDGSYSKATIIARINADLANDLGNLVQRSLTLATKNFSNKIPQPAAFNEADNLLLREAKLLVKILPSFIERQELTNYLIELFKLISKTNRYFASEEPWNLKKTDHQRFATVIFVTLELLRYIGIFLQPFMPDSADKLLNMLAVASENRLFANIENNSLCSEQELGKIEPLFPRYIENNKL